MLCFRYVSALCFCYDKNRDYLDPRACDEQAIRRCLLKKRKMETKTEEELRGFTKA